MLSRLLLVAALALAGCRSYDAATDPNGSTGTGAPLYAVGHTPHASLPLQELAQAKAVATRYHDVRKAIVDGYHDTGIVLPNMGRHFLKDELVDTKFEADHPALLSTRPTRPIFWPSSTRSRCPRRRRRDSKAMLTSGCPSAGCSGRCTRGCGRTIPTASSIRPTVGCSNSGRKRLTYSELLLVIPR